MLSALFWKRWRDEGKGEMRSVLRNVKKEKRETISNMRKWRKQKDVYRAWMHGAPAAELQISLRWQSEYWSSFGKNKVTLLSLDVVFLCPIWWNWFCFSFMFTCSHFIGIVLLAVCTWVYTLELLLTSLCRTLIAKKKNPWRNLLQPGRRRGRRGGGLSQ